MDDGEVFSGPISRGTPMMPSCIAEQRSKHRSYGRQLRGGCWTVGWNSIRRRRGSSIARMSCEREDTPMRSSIFLAMNSVQGSRSIAAEKSSPISVQRSRPKQPRRCGRPFGTGVCVNAATGLWKTCPASTIRSSEAGSNTTEGIVRIDGYSGATEQTESCLGTSS